MNKLFSGAYVRLLLAVCIAFGAVSVFVSQPNAQIADQTADQTAELARPADIALWPTLATTMRMSADDPTKPWQMRHIQMAPRDYARFVETGAYPDGATFTASMYAVAFDASYDPHLYYADHEVALAMEVIDRAHPDGRRFYVFGPGAVTAIPLPAGNACAACHTARGSFDATFAHLYPVIAPRTQARAPSTPQLPSERSMN